MPVWFKEKSLGEYVQITDDAVAAARHNPMLDEIRDPEELATLNAGTGEKPNLSEEHIVGYLGVKAVYEKQLTGAFETGDCKLFADVSSLGIDEVLSISGSLYKAGRGVQFPTPFSSDSSHCYFVYDENSKQVQAVSSSGWDDYSARVTLRYTKQ